MQHLRDGTGTFDALSFDHEQALSALARNA
jgi:hypothetical protein